MRLRRAAALMRSEHAVNDEDTSCRCEGQTDNWFDRSICPEPCGSMHNICVECSRVQGRCPVAETGRSNGNRLAEAWLAVADWLDDIAAIHWPKRCSRHSEAHYYAEPEHDHLAGDCDETCWTEAYICNGCGTSACRPEITPRALAVADTYLGSDS